MIMAAQQREIAHLKSRVTALTNMVQALATQPPANKFDWSNRPPLPWSPASS